jgi:hypothetical protein
MPQPGAGENPNVAEANRPKRDERVVSRAAIGEKFDLEANKANQVV